MLGASLDWSKPAWLNRQHGNPADANQTFACDGGSILHLHFINHFYIIGNMKIIKAVEALSALAQESRLSIFRLLVQAGKEGVPAGVLGEQLGIPAATLSFHLKELSHAKLIKSRAEGRYVIYSACFSEMDKLIAYLTENCCAGDAVQCAPRKIC